MPDGAARRSINIGSAIGHYSSAVVVDGFCFVSGQAAIGPDGHPSSDDITTQTTATIKAMAKVLGAAGYDLTDVVKVNCYLNNLDDWAAMDAEFAQFFPMHPPARATVQAKLIFGCLVEMDCVAWRKPTEP